MFPTEKNCQEETSENKKEILSFDFKRWQNEDVTNAQWKTGSSFFSPLTSPGLYFLPPHLRLKANSKNFSFQNHGQQLASGLGARGSQTRGKHPTKQILTEYILGPVLLDDTEIPIILTFKNSISSSHQHSQTDRDGSGALGSGFLILKKQKGQRKAVSFPTVVKFCRVRMSSGLLTRLPPSSKSLAIATAQEPNRENGLNLSKLELECKSS